MNIKRLRILLCVGWFSIAGAAHSTTITGEAGFVGLGWTPASLIDGTDFSTATGINFGQGLEVFAGGTGDYSSVLVGLPVKFGTIMFDPFPPIPQTPLWSFSYGGRTYSFALSALNVDHRTAEEIVLTGQGKLNISGLAETDGKWNFTGNTQGAVFTFSSGARATPIAAPEIDAASGTSAIALLVGALLLMAERSRRSMGTSVC